MGHGGVAPEDQMMTPGEVAALFRVDPRTVTRWAKIGKLPFVRTPGGHRRYREIEVRALFTGSEEGPGAEDVCA
jgi:excisionase family DNA binding protein